MSEHARETPPPYATRGLAAVVLVQALVLTATSGRYGYERDELYFRLLHPGWGYLDQPPLTPLLVRITRHVVADEVWALRISATLAAVASTLVVAAIAREVGGDRRAQLLAGWGYAFASFPLVLGHVLLTTSVDQPVWLGILLFVVRARVRGKSRAWLWAGVLTGLGLYNKLLLVVLLLAVAIGFLVAGPRRVLVSPPVLLAVLVALVVGLPNVIYQVAHGFPQLEFGRQLAAHNSGDVRVSMWPFLFLLLGPPLTVVWVLGLVESWRRPALRFLVPGFAALLVLVFVLGTQTYYPIGLVSALFAVGCVPLARWLTSRGRWTLTVTLGAVNAAVSAVLALPLVPVDALHDTPIPGINQAVADSVGWPRYAAQVRSVFERLPDRRDAVVFASNYGEAGAFDRYLPSSIRVFSAHNQLYFQGRPPDTVRTAVVVGGQADEARTLFRSCAKAGALDNGLGVDNEEQGEPIVVCREPVGGWRAIWPRLEHED